MLHQSIAQVTHCSHEISTVCPHGARDTISLLSKPRLHQKRGSWPSLGHVLTDSSQGFHFVIYCHHLMSTIQSTARVRGVTVRARLPGLQCKPSLPYSIPTVYILWGHHMNHFVRVFSVWIIAWIHIIYSDLKRDRVGGYEQQKHILHGIWDNIR